MNEFMENRRVRRVEGSGGFGYLLGGEEMFNNTDYRILQSRTDNVLLPCMKMKYNGRTELLMLTENSRPLSDLMMSMTAEHRITAAMSLLEAVREICGNGFLNVSCLDLSWDHIYVDSGTWRARLAYVPVYTPRRQSPPELTKELMRGLAGLLRRSGGDDADGATERFIAELEDPSVSIEQICRRRGEPEPSTEKDGGEAERPVSRLCARNTAEHFEIALDRDEVILGRSAGSADVVIPFSRAISRRHCRINRINGNCYVRDLGSANGTCVNRIRLTPQEACLLRRGDILRLADSEFEVG